jgi:uncharacterized protein YndB with AHSA1/START domain
MGVTDVRRDPAALTMTIESEWNAPIAAVWQLWADPRKLERWWGPPTYPATVVDHSLVPGATTRYYMTGPQGDRHHGWWRIDEVDEPHRVTFHDGFATEDGTPDDRMPVARATVTLEDRGGGITRMVVLSTFPSKEAMEQLLAMGMDEGMRQALGQIEAILASG